MRQVLDALRDIFWYALPGGLFLGMALISGRLSLARLGELFAPYHAPAWAVALLLLGACYLAGHLLAAIASLRADFWKLFHRTDGEWLAEYPTEANPRDLYLAHYFPDLLTAMERAQRTSLLLTSSVAALLLGWLVFYAFRPTFADMAIGTAVLVFIDVIMTTTQLSRTRKSIHAAGLALEEQEKAAKDSERAIQVNGDELRFMVDAIFRAVELSRAPQDGQGGRETPVPQIESGSASPEPVRPAPKFKTN